MTRIAYVIRQRGIQERSGGNTDYGKRFGHRRRCSGIGGGDCGGGMRGGEKGEIKERLIYSLLLLNKSAFSCVFFFIKGFIVKLWVWQTYSL